jgi:hypothetical protein
MAKRKLTAKQQCPKAWQVKGKKGHCKLSAKAKKMSYAQRKKQWPSYCRRGKRYNTSIKRCVKKRRKSTKKRKSTKRRKSVALRSTKYCGANKVPYKSKRGFKCRACPPKYHIIGGRCRKKGAALYSQTIGPGRFIGPLPQPQDQGIIKTVTDTIGLTTPPPTRAQLLLGAPPEQGIVKSITDTVGLTTPPRPLRQFTVERLSSARRKLRPVSAQPWQRNY